MISALLLVVFGITTLMAQNESEKRVKIDITITENGETKKIVKEIIIDSDGDVDIDELLQDIDELKDIDVSGDGENIQIIVKKSGGSDDFDFDFDFDIDIDTDHMEEMLEMHTMKREKMMGERKNKGFLGVYIKSTGEDAEAKGSIINKVIANSGAEKAGLEEGDIITKVNGKSVDGYESLVEELRSYKPGEAVSIDYIRNGKSQSTEATLQERSAQVHCAPGNFKWESYGGFDPFEHHMKYMAKSHNGPFLGVSPVKDFNGEGVKIGKVYENSAAKSMGLEENDVINSVNGETIKDFEDLKKVIGEMERGDKIKVGFTRDGKKMKESGELKAKFGSFGFRCDFKCCDKDGPNCCSKANASASVMIMNIEIDDIEEEDSDRLKDNSGMDITDKSDMRIESIEFLPNPSNGNFKLGFKPANKGKVTVRIVDMNGKTVYEVEMGAEKDRYNLDIDISDQPDGIYFLTLSQNGKQFNKKLIVQ